MTMSDNPQAPILKNLDDLAPDSVPFINMAAGVGINSISDPSLSPEQKLTLLHKVLTDIQNEIIQKDDESEEDTEETEEPFTIYHCYQCATVFRNDPVGYAKCLQTCIP